MGMLGKLFGTSGGSESMSGYGAMSPYGQGAYDILAKNANTFLDPNQNAFRFTPQGVTSDEERAFQMMRSGFAPTEQSLGRDVSMLMNPFNDAVIGDINREAQGQNSILQQNLSAAGQFGSNRQFLGAGDIENQRLNNIGRFRQEQYNNAINQALGPLAQLRQGDAQNLLSMGGFMRNLDLQTKQAPVSALQSLGGIVSQLPQSSVNRTQNADPGMLNRMSGFARGVMLPPGQGGLGMGGGGGGFGGGMSMGFPIP